MFVCPLLEILLQIEDELGRGLLFNGGRVMSRNNDDSLLLLLFAISGIVACYSIGSVLSLLPMALGILVGAYVLSLGSKS